MSGTSHHEDAAASRKRRDAELMASALIDLAARAAGVRIEDLERRLREVNEDRAAKAEVIERLSGELADVRADQQAKQTLIESISAELEEVRADQQAKEALIQRQDAMLRGGR